jgi:hypothetical protein
MRKTTNELFKVYPYRTPPKPLNASHDSKVIWCKNQYGYSGERWDWNWDRESYMPVFHFKEEKDLTWFILNWS